MNYYYYAPNSKFLHMVIILLRRFDISVPNLSACAVCVLRDRNSKVIEGIPLDQMDVFKAINVFREHTINQKSFFKAV